MASTQARVVEFGSVRPCEECGQWYPWDNPDADIRICPNCHRTGSSEP